jgi:hypothetical protein
MLLRCVTEALVKDATPAGLQPTRKANPKGELMIVDADEQKGNEEGCC